jgi:hypothetical protein
MLQPGIWDRLAGPAQRSAGDPMVCYGGECFRAISLPEAHRFSFVESLFNPGWRVKSLARSAGKSPTNHVPACFMFSAYRGVYRNLDQATDKYYSFSKPDGKIEATTIGK